MLVWRALAQGKDAVTFIQRSLVRLQMKPSGEREIRFGFKFILLP